ncbi:MAG: filamentous hemagglutinin N-terminal domain-containing protein [Candidatus Omnitrophica bacterium]|nr:filamentous hemagglutinin N-terminal domain-containing protein [Candidatus Omnitrophota bacterium]
MEDKKFKQINLLTFYPIFVLLIIGLVVYPLPVASGDDLPVGPQVQAGAPTITTAGNDMTVNANQFDKTWIDWQSFNIGAQNSVNNIGPSSSAVILHNDVSGAISNIQGALNGNCNVFLLNPSGILFGSGAQVNVGGMVVSTMRMSMDDFMSGSYLIKQDSVNPGLIVNSGTINANGPMGVTLAGGAVRNDGVINANLSTVNLVSGREVTLNVNNEGSIQVALDKQVLSEVHDQNGNKVNIGVDNIGQINADGGRVYIQAEAMQGVFSKLINQEGVVKAGSMVNKDGKIVLISNSDGIVQNIGTLDASAIEAGAKGGVVEMKGEKVGQFGTVHADAIDGDGGNVNLYARDVVALSSDSLTTANAGLNGDGGNVIVFSPETALFWPDAKIEAKGGVLSGDGGFVEVSGKEHVEIYGLVDTLAPAGKNGMFLIDPTNVTITGDNANGDWSLFPTLTGIWTPNDTGSVANVNAALALGSVTITTNFAHDPAEEGNITVSGAIAASANANSLILQAANDIILNAAIDMSLGTGNLTLTADSDTSGAGAIVDGTGVITMNASGDLIISAGDGVGTNLAQIETVGVTDLNVQTTTGGIFINNSTSGDINIQGLGLDAGAGNISITNTGRNITVTSAVDTDNGTVTLSGALLTNNSTIDATGEIELNASGNLDTNANITSSAGNVDLNITGSVDVQAGARVIAGGNETALTIDAAGITLNAGASVANATVTNTGSGTIALTSTGSGDITLANNAISIADGTLTLTATGDDIVVTTDAGSEIEADGNVTLDGAAIGATNGGLDITGDAGGDRTLTITSSAAAGEAIDIDMATDQFSAVSVTLADADSEVDINLSGGDSIDIDGTDPTSTINTAVLNNLAVGFTYTLSEAAKNVAISNIDASTGSVSITASSGTLTVSDTTGGIVATGASNITLSSSGAVTVADPITTVGGTFISSGTTFDNTSGIITTGAGSITITQTGAITIGANLSTENDIDIDTTSTFAVTAGARLIGGGDLDTLTINAAGITIGAGGVGTETLTNTGSGTITITDTSNTVLGNNAISIASGTLAIDSANINAAADDVDVEIDADGDVSITAASIGGTQPIDISGDVSGNSALTVNSDGDGNVNLDIGTDLFSAVNIIKAGVTTDTININWDADLIDMSSNGTTMTINSVSTSAFDPNVSITQSLGNVAVTVVNTDAGNFSLTASSGTLTVTAAAGGITTTGGGDITLTSSGLMSVADSLSAGDAISLSVTTSDTNLGITDTVTAGGTLTLRSDDMSIAAATTGANIYIYTKDADTVISLGTDTATANQLDLTEAELKYLASSGTVTIGQDGTNSAAINIGDAVDLSGETFGVTLATEGAIDATGAGHTLALANTKVLTLDAGTSIGATNAVTTAATVINADAGTGNLTLTNTGDVTDLQLNANSGTITFNNTGSVNTGAAITANIINLTSSGIMTIDQNITADTGAVTLTSTADDTAETFVQSAGIISSTAGALTITADDMSLTGTITAGAQVVTLKSYTAGDPIILRDASASAHTLEISDAELNTITTSNGVVIGSTSAGTITVAGNITNHAGYSNLTLITGSTISDNASDYTIGTSGTLTLDSATGISGVGGVSNNSLATAAATLAARTRTSGNILISELDAVTIGSAVNPSTAFNGITTASNGNIALETRGDTLTINKPITANGSGTVIIDATNQSIIQNSGDTGTISSNSGNITVTFGHQLTILFLSVRFSLTGLVPAEMFTLITAIT